MLGETAPPAALSDLRTKLGLDRPFLVQYGDFLAGLVVGDLGTSFRYRTPVTQEIGQRLGATAELALVAMVVAVAIVAFADTSVLSRTFAARSTRACRRLR